MVAMETSHSLTYFVFHDIGTMVRCSARIHFTLCDSSEICCGVTFALLCRSQRVGDQDGPGGQWS